MKNKHVLVEIPNIKWVIRNNEKILQASCRKTIDGIPIQEWVDVPIEILDND